MNPVQQQEVLRELPQPQPLPLPPPPRPVKAPPPRPEPDVTSEGFLRYGVALYRAAMRGDWVVVNSIVTQSRPWIHAKITKGGETVLHIAAAAKHVHLVKNLVDILEADSLAGTNKVGNTALCFAAVSGVVEIARVMVEKNKVLPNIRGSQEMTPLHMAVLLGHRKMVWYLLEVTDDEQLTDKDRIELLTSSIETDMFDVALHLLYKHRHLAVLRDAKEETALHALARKPLKSGGYRLNMWKRFTMQWNRVDEEKSAEAHIAVQLIQSLWDEVIKLKDDDISKLICYPWRVLFVAAKLGKVEFLTTLIRSYPDLIWKVDEGTRTIFHVAIIYRHEQIFKLIYEIGAIKDLIATYKDGSGNNMLHLAGKLAPPHRLNCVSGAALQMQHEILWFKAVKKIVRPEYAEAENEDHKTPHALFSEEHEGLRAKGEEWMKKTAESCALVATLIATVVFSAAFQLPGGVDSKGSPNLVKKASFVVFAMSNAVSLFTSTASVLMFLSILTSRYAEVDFLVSLPVKLMSGLILLLVSIATMIVAFTATFFITFHEGMRWASIPIALIACIPVTLFALQQFPLLIDIFHSTYKSRSIIESGKSELFELSSIHDFPAHVHANATASSHFSVSNTSSYSLPNISFSCQHLEASRSVTTSTYFSSHRPTVSDPTLGRASRTSFHRPTASRIVDPTASGQGTPTPRSLGTSTSTHSAHSADIISGVKFVSNGDSNTASATVLGTPIGDGLTASSTAMTRSFRSFSNPS